MPITLTETADSSTTVLGVAGDVDLSTAGQLGERLAEIIDRVPRTVVVDLGEVTFLDSTGLSALVSAHTTARAQGLEMIVARPTQEIAILFRITGLNKVITVVDP